MHYQGKIPPHVSKKIRLQKQKLQEKEYELKQFEEGSASSPARRSKDSSSFERDHFGGSSDRGGRDSDPYDWYDRDKPREGSASSGAHPQSR